MVKIVISGSNGFIGRRLVNEFSNKHEYTIECLDIVNGHDLCQPKTIPNIGPFDILIHLAALSFVPESFTKPKQYYHTNINSTLNALELCRTHNAKMVFLSSYVYGKPEYLPVDENHPIKAFNPYAQTKIIGERLCEGYSRDFGVACTILRPFNIYGEGQSKCYLLSSIVNQIKSGKKIIKLLDPNPRRDFVHVDDLVKAIILVINSLLKIGNQFKYYNIASGNSYSVLELTDLIKNLDETYRDIKFEFSPHKSRKNEVNETVGSYKKIKQDLGWQPSITIDAGLRNWLAK